MLSRGLYRIADHSFEEQAQRGPSQKREVVGCKLRDRPRFECQLRSIGKVDERIAARLSHQRLDLRKSREAVSRQLHHVAHGRARREVAYEVVAAALGDDERIVASASQQVVVAQPAIEIVGTRAAKQLIETIAALQRVRAVAAVKLVIARVASQSVVAEQTDQDVVARKTAEHVGVIVAAKRVVEIRTRQPVDKCVGIAQRITGV